MQGQLKEKDDLIELLERRVIKRSREQEGLFPSSTSAIPTSSGDWKSMMDRVVKEKEKEKEAMESYYKKEIKRIRMKYQPGFGSASDMMS